MAVGRTEAQLPQRGQGVLMEKTQYPVPTPPCLGAVLPLPLARVPGTAWSTGWGRAAEMGLIHPACGGSGNLIKEGNVLRNGNFSLERKGPEGDCTLRLPNN